MDIVSALKLLTNTNDKPAFLWHVADVLAVAFLIAFVLRLIRGAQAMRILFGILVFFLALGVSKALDLRTLNWILDKATTLLPLAVVILFLPQLRAAIEKFSLLPEFEQAKTNANTLETVIAATMEMARTRTGALIVIDHLRRLDDVIATGTVLDANVSQALLQSIFYELNTLHDGAVVIRGDKITAAACQLPLANPTRLDKNMHMRHRAAAGVTEAHECLCIVVSEERGAVTVAHNGTLRHAAEPGQLRAMLRELMQSEDEAKPPKRGLRNRRGKKNESESAAPEATPTPEVDKPEAVLKS